MEEDLIEAELSAAEEWICSGADDIRGRRWGSATAALYSALEHLVKALLASVGIETRSHEGVKVPFSMHFIKPGSVQ